MDLEIRVRQNLEAGKGTPLPEDKVFLFTLEPGQTGRITANPLDNSIVFVPEDESSLLDCGRFTYDIGGRVALFDDGRTERLSIKEHSLALPMFNHPNTVFTNKQLMEFAWPEVRGGERTAHYLRLYKKYLNEKLGDGDYTPFHNVWGNGYYFYNPSIASEAVQRRIENEEKRKKH